MFNDNLQPTPQKTRKLKGQKAKAIPNIGSFMQSIAKYEQDKNQYKQLENAMKLQQESIAEFTAQNQLKKEIEDDIDLLQRFDKLQNYVDKDGKLTMSNLAKFINEVNLGKYVKENIMKIQNHQQKFQEAAYAQQELQKQLEKSNNILKTLDEERMHAQQENKQLTNQNIDISFQNKKLQDTYNEQKELNTLLQEEYNKNQKNLEELQDTYNEQKELNTLLQEEYNKNQKNLEELQENVKRQEEQMNNKLAESEQKIQEIDKKYLSKKHELKNVKQEIKQNYQDFIDQLRNKEGQFMIDIKAEQLKQKEMKDKTYYDKHYRPKFYQKQQENDKEIEIDKQYEGTQRQRKAFEMFKHFKNNQFFQDIDLEDKSLSNYEKKFIEDKYNEADKYFQEQKRPDYFSSRLLGNDKNLLILDNIGKLKKKGEKDVIDEKIQEIASKQDPFDEIYFQYENIKTKNKNNKQQYVNDLKQFHQNLKFQDQYAKTFQERAHIHNLKQKTKETLQQLELQRKKQQKQQEQQEQQEPQEEEIPETNQMQANGKYIKYSQEQIPRILIIGAPGSGKTTAALQLIENLQDPNTHTFIITQNYNEQKYIDPQNINNYYSNAQQKETQTMDHEELLMKVVEQAQQIKDNNGNTIIMLDDLPQLLKNKKVNHFLRTTRAMNCIFIVVCHDITDVAKSDRSQFSNLLLFSGQQTRLKEVADMQQVNLKQLKELYDKNVQKPGDFLLFQREMATIIKNGFTEEILLQPTYLNFQQKTIQPNKIQQNTSFPKDGLTIEQVNEQLKYVSSYNGVIVVDATKDESTRKIPIDKIPQTNIFFVENYNEKGNNHYTALGIDTQEICYYDSYGQPPCQEIMEMIHNTKLPGQHFLKLKINTIQQQSDDSSTCGQFAIDFIKKFTLGYPFREITKYNNIVDNEAERVDDYQHFKRFSFI